MLNKEDIKNVLRASMHQQIAEKEFMFQLPISSNSGILRDHKWDFLNQLCDSLAEIDEDFANDSENLENMVFELVDEINENNEDKFIEHASEHDSIIYVSQSLADYFESDEEDPAFAAFDN